MSLPQINRENLRTNAGRELSIEDLNPVLQLKRKLNERSCNDNSLESNSGYRCTTIVEPVISDEEIVDISLSSPSNYFVVFSKIPKLVYFLQSFSLPSVTNRKITINMPNHASNFHVAGHTTDYDDFMLNFLMDENFKCYFELLDWIRRNEVKDEFKDTESRMTIVLLNNSKTPIVRVTASMVIPTTLGEVSYMNQTADPLTFYAMFSHYTYSVEYIDKSLVIPYKYGKI